MEQGDKLIRIKNKFDATFWLSMIFIGVMLILAFVILKTKLVQEDNCIYRIAGVNRGIPIELRGFSGFEPAQRDVSADVKFLKPRGIFDDVKGARKCGIYKLYKSSNPLLVSPKSIIAITFAKKLNKGYELKEFIWENIRNLRLMYPGQPLTIGIVNLPWDVIEKFEIIRMPYYTMAFHFHKTVDRPAQSCAVFFFETDDGVWSIIWTAPWKILDNEKGRERGIFLSMIKYFMMGIMDFKSKNFTIVI